MKRANDVSLWNVDIQFEFNDIVCMLMVLYVCHLKMTPFWGNGSLRGASGRKCYAHWTLSLVQHMANIYSHPTQQKFEKTEH